MNEAGNFETMKGGQEKNPEIENVLLDQAKAIMGGVEVDPEMLAKLMAEKSRSGQLVGSKFDQEARQMNHEDFLEIAKKAVEELRDSPEEEPTKDGPVMTMRDIPKSPMNDPE